jgi:hypothetical protein
MHAVEGWLMVSRSPDGAEYAVRSLAQLTAEEWLCSCGAVWRLHFDAEDGSLTLRHGEGEAMYVMPHAEVARLGRESRSFEGTSLVPWIERVHEYEAAGGRAPARR